MGSSVCQLSNMYGVKTIIALAVLGQFHASAKGLSLGLKRDSPCFPNPCCGGECRAKWPNGYFCQCPEGFTGNNCEENIAGVTLQASKKCEDYCEYQCPIWAEDGACDKNPHWMKVYCRKSCNTCKCADLNVTCPTWAEKGECAKNPSWMTVYCKLSCKQC